jgi:hypothetical protein
MLHLRTNLPADLLTPFFSDRLQTNVDLRRTEHGYLMNCTPTPLYLNWVQSIQDAYVVYYRDIPILIQPLSKL